MGLQADAPHLRKLRIDLLEGVAIHGRSAVEPGGDDAILDPDVEIVPLPRR
jgi:hypothetical protein